MLTILFIIAIGLFFARQYSYVSNENLQTIATIVAIISGLAAIFVFIIPQAIPPDPTPTAIPSTPTPSIGTTMLGQDDMTLLYVPAGKFWRGSNRENDPDDEKPQRSIYLDAFWIDETEVTNEMFADFLNQQGNQVEGGTTWLNMKSFNVLIFKNDSSFEPKEGFANHPAIEMTWYGANAYCQSVGRRLPTEAEWEKAARGTDGRVYPWGNKSVAGNLVNLCDKNCEFNDIEPINDGYAKSAFVGHYPDGASPYGALDMAGNVWEWTADWDNAEYYNHAPVRNPQGPDIGEERIIRGGSWSNGASRIRAGERFYSWPAFDSHVLGFRCAVSP